MAYENEFQNNKIEGFDDVNLTTPSIKIIKNTKGYNFEFKILSLDTEEMDKIHNKIMEKVKSWESKENE